MDLIIKMGLFLMLIIVLLSTSLIKGKIERTRYYKNHSICPKCGNKMILTVSSKELDPRYNSLAGKYSTQITEYYHVLLCERCYYVIDIHEHIKKENMEKRIKAKEHKKTGDN